MDAGEWLKKHIEAGGCMESDEWHVSWGAVGKHCCSKHLRETVEAIYERADTCGISMIVSRLSSNDGWICSYVPKAKAL